MEKVKTSKIIDRAKLQVSGFSEIFAKLEQNVLLGGLSESTLLNYGRWGSYTRTTKTTACITQQWEIVGKHSER